VLKAVLGRGLKTKLNREDAKNAKRVFCLVCSDSGRRLRIITDQALRAGRGGILFADFGLLE